MEFKKLKETIIQAAKERKACKDEFAKAVNSESKAELLEVVKSNFAWCWTEGVVDVKILQGFGKRACNALDVYFEGEIDKIEGKSSVILCGDVIVKMLDSSTVQAMWGSSTVQAMRGSSTVQAMWGSSTVQAMRGSSTVQKMLDSSTVQAMWGSSTVQKMLDSSTVRTFNGNIPEDMEGGNYSIIDLKNKIIFCGKNFEIQRENNS